MKAEDDYIKLAELFKMFDDKTRGMILSKFVKASAAVSLGFLILAYIILGGDVVIRAVKNIAKGRVFDENFLMSVSTIGAFIIGEYPEAVAVMLFYQVGEYFQETAVKRGGHNIPKDDVQRRFSGRWEAVAKVLPYCDEAEFYDNDNGFVKVAEYCNGELRTIGNHVPNWLSELQNHLKP